jgi:cytoskeleton protein RodZ
MGRSVALVESVKPDFGHRMKRLREERGVTLRQIADATKLSVAALEALERNDISRLPGGIFSRGFVRSYAVEVGLDPEQTVRDFLVQFPHDSVTVGSPHAPPDHRDRTHTSSRTGETLAVALLTIAAIVGVVLFFTLSTR